MSTDDDTRDESFEDIGTYRKLVSKVPYESRSIIKSVHRLFILYSEVRGQKQPVALTLSDVNKILFPHNEEFHQAIKHVLDALVEVGILKYRPSSQDLEGYYIYHPSNEYRT